MASFQSPSAPLPVLVLWKPEGGWYAREELTTDRERVGCAVGMGFSMERDGPDAVTPIDAEDGVELGAMEGVGKGRVEAGKQLF